MEEILDKIISLFEAFRASWKKSKGELLRGQESLRDGLKSLEEEKLAFEREKTQTESSFKKRGANINAEEAEFKRRALELGKSEKIASDLMRSAKIVDEDLKKREERIKTSLVDLELREKKVVDAALKLSEKEEDLNSREGSVSKRETLVSKREEDTGSREQSVSERERKVSEKESSLVHFERELKKKQFEVVEGEVRNKKMEEAIAKTVEQLESKHDASRVKSILGKFFK